MPSQSVAVMPIQNDAGQSPTKSSGGLAPRRISSEIEPPV
jgi:hypothetical protein